MCVKWSSRRIFLKKQYKSFMRIIFSNKSKLYIVWNWFIAKIYFNLTKIVLLRLFKIAANQRECSRLEQRSVMKSLLAKKSKPCGIYRRMENCVLDKKFHTNGLNLMSLCQKDCPWSANTLTLWKRKNSGYGSQ